MPSAMNARLEGMFEQAGCRGQLCVQSLDGAQEIAVDADKQVVAASVFKVLVALEAETQFAACRLDPRERVDLHVASRTPGPTGFSLFRDDIDVSLRDLVVAMLTISDNEATDALLRSVGIETVNASAKRLGLGGTVITGDLRTTVNSIGRDAGFGDWPAMVAWAAAWSASSATRSASSPTPTAAATWQRFLPRPTGPGRTALPSTPSSELRLPRRSAFSPVNPPDPPAGPNSGKTRRWRRSQRARPGSKPLHAKRGWVPNPGHALTHPPGRPFAAARRGLAGSAAPANSPCGGRRAGTLRRLPPGLPPSQGGGHASRTAGGGPKRGCRHRESRAGRGPPAGPEPWQRQGPGSAWPSGSGRRDRASRRGRGSAASRCPRRGRLRRGRRRSLPAAGRPPAARGRAPW